MSDVPVALITGAARRVGAAIAKTLHGEGYRIVVHYQHSSAQAQTLVAQFNEVRENSAVALAADLLCHESLQQLASQALAAWQRIDVLVNNASSFYATPLGATTESNWNDLLGTNLKAPYFLSQALHLELKKYSGCIVNISDIFAQRPRMHYSAYCIAKAGNDMLTQSLALELAPDVRVNGVAPGAVMWPENDKGQAIENTEMLKDIPLARLGGEQVIAKAVRYLVLEAPYTTGQILRVDGGRSLRQ
ncbi:MAG: pteridine reductase [Alteromonadaceae bacterium]|nr:MAG: pteridine reductase [Alteromonadaceae bacterium]